MIKAAVIGHPIAHSKSPLIHGHWIVQYGLEGSYEAIDIPCESLEEEVRNLAARGYAGFNVTIPHKEVMLGICDELSEEARAIGAVNTVIVREDKLYGTNTDAFGFIQNIKSEAPGFDFTAGPAVLLGAGGAARAIVHGLLDEGAAEIVITNRTAAKAEALREAYGAPEKIRIIDWEERSAALAGANLLVNSTALGMEGQAPLEIDLDVLPVGALVTDIVYAPLETPLLAAAKARGNITVGGIGMLLHQARPAFESWFSVMPEVSAELQQKVLAS